MSAWIEIRHGAAQLEGNHRVALYMSAWIEIYGVEILQKVLTSHST